MPKNITRACERACLARSDPQLQLLNGPRSERYRRHARRTCEALLCPRIHDIDLRSQKHTVIGSIMSGPHDKPHTPRHTALQHNQRTPHLPLVHENGHTPDAGHAVDEQQRANLPAHVADLPSTPHHSATMDHG